MVYREYAFLKSKHYEIEITEDRSPTLRPENKESMHHMGGAASESVYLYYEALVRFFSFRKNEDQKTRVLSFGFGMGYNELLTVLFFLKNKLNFSKLILESREKDIFLYDIFNSWLVSSDKHGSVFDEVYNGIQRALPGIDDGFTIQNVKENLLALQTQGQWLQNGPVYQVTDFHGPYDVIFYDAYSAKTNDYLWSEEFLTLFFSSHLNANFIFSTYACTSVLKRVAANTKSEFDKRPGFKGKRNSSIISS